MQWIFLLGAVTGSRTMTAIAVLCWAAWLRIIPEHGWAVWITYLVSALVFTGLAIGEYIGDTRPNTPSRKENGPAASRLIFGGLVGALVATSVYQPLVGGILVGVLGAFFGTWAGYALRVRGARLLGRDLPVALTESLLALLLAVFAVLKLHQDHLIDLYRGVI